MVGFFLGLLVGVIVYTLIDAYLDNFTKLR